MIALKSWVRDERNRVVARVTTTREPDAWRMIVVIEGIASELGPFDVVTFEHWTLISAWNAHKWAVRGLRPPAGSAQTELPALLEHWENRLARR